MHHTMACRGITQLLSFTSFTCSRRVTILIAVLTLQRCNAAFSAPPFCNTWYELSFTTNDENYEQSPYSFGRTWRSAGYIIWYNAQIYGAICTTTICWNRITPPAYQQSFKHRQHTSRGFYPPLRRIQSGSRSYASNGAQASRTEKSS